MEVALWVVVALVAYGLTYKFDRVTPTYDFGPTAWPRALLIGVLVAAAALWWYGDGEEANGDARQKEEPQEEEPPQGRAHQVKRLLIFAGPLLYVWAMDYVGFLLATPFFLFGYLRLLGCHKWIPLTILTVAIYGVVLLVFVKLLFTPLPQGAGFFNSLNGEITSLIR